MQLISSINSGHRLHLSVCIHHCSAQRFPCCIITCLEVTPVISSGAHLLDSSPAKLRSTSVFSLIQEAEKKRTSSAPIPSAQPSLLCLHQLCMFLICCSAHMLSVMWKSACQVTFSLPQALSKEIIGFKHLSYMLHCLGLKRATLIPEET